MVINKKSWFFGVIVVFLCICLYINKALAASYEKMDIDTLFKAAKCQWTQTHINAWTVTDLGNTTIDDLKSMGKEACEFFNLVDLDISTNCNSHLKQVNIRARDQKYLKYDIIITSSKQTHIVINLFNDQHFIGTQELVSKIKDYFFSIETLPHVSTTHVGIFDGRLDTQQIRSILNGLVTEIDGRVTQTMEDDRLISLAGHSPVIDIPPIESINFQIASRYCEYEGKTYLWTGTPLITIEY